MGLDLELLVKQLAFRNIHLKLLRVGNATAYIAGNKYVDFLQNTHQKRSHVLRIRVTGIRRGARPRRFVVRISSVDLSRKDILFQKFSPEVLEDLIVL